MREPKRDHHEQTIDDLEELKIEFLFSTEHLRFPQEGYARFGPEREEKAEPFTAETQIVGTIHSAGCP